MANDKKRILLWGDGYPASIWRRCLRDAETPFLEMGTGIDEELPRRRAEVIIDTEDNSLALDEHEGHDELDDTLAELENLAATEEEQDIYGGLEAEPTDTNGNGHTTPLADEMPAELLDDNGLLLVPTYWSSPTMLAAAYEGWEDRAVGYTLFPAPPGREGPPIIEIARPLQADDTALDRAREFLTGSGFRVETVGDAPGLVFGRTLSCLINEAAYALGEGLGSAEDIDNAMKLGLNYPKGLLEWADDLGLDMVLGILTGLHDFYLDERYRPAPLLRHMFIAGRHFRPGK